MNQKDKKITPTRTDSLFQSLFGKDYDGMVKGWEKFREKPKKLTDQEIKRRRMEEAFGVKGVPTFLDSLEFAPDLLKKQQLEGIVPTINQEIKDYEAILRGMPTTFFKKPIHPERAKTISKYLDKLYKWKFQGLKYKPTGAIPFEEVEEIMPEIIVPGYERKNK